MANILFANKVGFKINVGKFTFNLSLQTVFYFMKLLCSLYLDLLRLSSEDFSLETCINDLTKNELVNHAMKSANGRGALTVSFCSLRCMQCCRLVSALLDSNSRVSFSGRGVCDGSEKYSFSWGNRRY